MTGKDSAQTSSTIVDVGLSTGTCSSRHPPKLRCDLQEIRLAAIRIINITT